MATFHPKRKILKYKNKSYKFNLNKILDKKSGVDIKFLFCYPLREVKRKIACYQKKGGFLDETDRMGKNSA